MKDKILNVFKNLKVIKVLMPGAQKEVFVVDYPPFGVCILKVIPASGIDRVEREVKIITENSITHVPAIFESSRFKIDSNEYLYIFEEYINGCSLSDRLKQGKLSLEEGVKLLETLLSVAMELEMIGVVHRDIKPDNILVSKNNEYYLIDFGIARALKMTSLTNTHVAVGPHTPGYGAPELFQYNKNEISIKADLFSIGVVVFQAVTGKHPFLDGSENDMADVWYKTAAVIPYAILVDGDTQQLFMGLVSTLMKQQISKRPPSARKAYDWLMTAKDTFVLRGK